ncbi:MAG TPA: phosphoribosylamine--glycine ligase [Vicinamibacterales bacterium]|nr:phosphoribosylamine--glycine ligase [Vicinamibacterales bacterium]
MRILVIGGGGREHALAAKLAPEHGVSYIACAPGNPGMRQVAAIEWVDPSDPDAVLALVERLAIDLTVVGPELPLDRGVADRLHRAGRPVFGPTRAAAQLECSKVFAKQFMARHGIPTARYRVCTAMPAAQEIVASGELGFPVVVKADGLAAGKGVVVAADAAEADAAIRAAMEERRFGSAGSRVVIEECLSGPEVSFFAICDGERALPLTSAQDHKRIFDDDRGPNTGGMGAFAPSPLVDDDLRSRILHEIVEPVLRGMRADGTPYIGFLYAGLMLTCAGPKVIEFNVRFGDPEAQVVMPLIASDLHPLLAAAADGSLGENSVAFKPQASVGVVLASRGYPGEAATGQRIEGLEDAASTDGVTIFHAGTAMKDNYVVTAGGRVLTVVAVGDDYAQARSRAYEAAGRVHFDGMQYRRDIGLKAI